MPALGVSEMLSTLLYKGLTSKCGQVKVQVELREKGVHHC